MFLIALAFVFAVGAALGSFSVAQVWRIRARQLKLGISSGEKVNQDEWRKIRQLSDPKKLKDRSRCLNCGYQLRWYDLIPIFSWVSLRGKCRKCNSSIGWTEFLAEVSLAVVFSLVFITNFSSLASTLDMIVFIKFIIMAVCLSMMMIMFVYDARWSLLPTKVIYMFVATSILYWMVSFIQVGLSSIDYVAAGLNLSMSMLIFPMLYLFLSYFSKGEWVGDGDWVLAVGLIFLLPNQPIYSAIAMFLSNLFGILTVFILSAIKKQKIRRGVKIPFGPMMILAAVVILILGHHLDNMIAFLM